MFYTASMARPPVYVNPSDEEKVSRNPRAEEISAELRRRTIERIDAGDNERVDDPLAMLIEDARASS